MDRVYTILFTSLFRPQSQKSPPRVTPHSISQRVGLRPEHMEHMEHYYKTVRLFQRAKEEKRIVLRHKGGLAAGGGGSALSAR